MELIKKEDLMLDIDTIDTVDITDLMILCSYAKTRKEILETGTRFGRTTMNLAKFCPPDGRVVSIDLDQSNAQQTLERMPLNIANKVTLIEHDTNTFDFSTIGKFDMIFIDGDHTSNGVINDTLNAIKILKPGGIIIWHDFQSLPIKVGLFTLRLDRTQIGKDMGLSKGKQESFLTDRGVNDQLRLVRNWITNLLKERGIE